MKTEEIPTEERILKAAEEEFLEKGFDNARTTEIARKAGVTHAMLHYYFRTKEQIFNMTIKAKANELAESVVTCFADNTLPLKERLEKGISSHFDFLMDNPRLPGFILKDFSRIDDETAAEVFLKMQPAIESLKKDLGSEIDTKHLLIDIMSQNIFPFLTLPVLRRLETEDNDKESLLEEIKRENVTIILKRLGL